MAQNFNNMDKPENFKIEKVIDHLRGTVGTIENSMIELYGDDYDHNCLNADDIKAINEKLFECDECGKWLDHSEHVEQPIEPKSNFTCCKNCFAEDN